MRESGPEPSDTRSSLKRMSAPIRVLVCAVAVATGIVSGIAPAVGVASSHVKPSASPSPRALAAMGLDRTKNIVLFGGVGVWPTVFDDTWTWNGTAWTQMQGLTTHPSARYASGMAYDAAHGQTVLFGGLDEQGGLLGDTWTWDGSTWTERHPASHPTFSAAFGMVYDAARHQVLLFMGEPEFSYEIPWAWNGSNWKQLTATTLPSWREYSGAAYDAARRQTVMFGGSDLQEFQTTYDDTWTWTGADWALQNPAAHPSYRTRLGMAYDAARQRVVLFGGTGGGPHNDTWTWNGHNWQLRSPANSPAARYDVTLVWDTTRRQVVLFGGIDGNQNLLGDTWTWDGFNWTQH